VPLPQRSGRAATDVHAARVTVPLSPPAWHELARTVARHRRFIAAGLTAAAVALALHALSPPPPPATLVVTASHDLAGGTALRPGDVTRTPLPVRTVPDGAITAMGSVVGRLLAGPVRAGQTITDVQLVGRSLLAGYGPGLVASPVRIADGASVSLLRVGDLIDVLATDLRGAASTSTVAYHVPVIMVPVVSSDGGPTGTGALVVLGVPSEVARSLASAAVTNQLSFILCGQTCSE
jgi:pilus assembly protein CpaB